MVNNVAKYFSKRRYESTKDKNDYDRNDIAKISYQKIDEIVDELYQKISPLLVKEAKKGNTSLIVNPRNFDISFTNSDIVDILAKKLRKKRFNVEIYENYDISNPFTDDSSDEDGNYVNKCLRIDWK